MNAVTTKVEDSKEKTEKDEEKSRNYIEPEIFFKEMLECLSAGKMSNDLGRMFMLISERFVNHPNFVRYTHLREELISTGIAACCRAYSQFRPDRNILTYGEEVVDGETQTVITHTDRIPWNGEIVPYDYTKHYNPHAFFSTVINNAILQLLKKEYDHRNSINAWRLQNGLEADYGYVEMMKEREEKKKAQDIKDKEENGGMEEVVEEVSMVEQMFS